MLESSKGNWAAVLHHFVSPLAPLVECELCAIQIEADHQHLIETGKNRLLCVCDSCGLLFSGHQAAYCCVPKGVRRLDQFEITDQQWDTLLIPIGMAFFYYCSSAGRVIAMYPGPAGSTESLLDLNAWQQLAVANPILDELKPDVEALLVNRVDGARAYYRVPIDHCYILTGLIRRHWRGLSGGSEVRQAIEEFFAWLHKEADSLGEWCHA